MEPGADELGQGRALAGSSRRERPGVEVDCSQRPIPAVGGATALPPGSFLNPIKRAFSPHACDAQTWDCVPGWYIAAPSALQTASSQVTRSPRRDRLDRRAGGILSWHDLTSTRIRVEARAQREAGVALIIVLGFLVIISVLVVSFLSSVSTELTSAKSEQASVSTRQLAESTTSLVISQIADATAGFKDPQDPSSGVLAWASQPGMIRTYTDEGEPYKYYKLYSGRNMVLSSLSSDYNVNDEFAADVPEQWHERPAEYVDLNAPVRDVDKRYRYPIVNPKAQRSAPNQSPETKDGVDGFEIIDPPGFEGPAGPGASGTRPPEDDSKYDPTARPNANPAPMPVRWLYVLQDGSIAPAPETNSKGALEWSEVSDSEPKPSAENPIVGRVAFWTDDDTSKVNVNTASEGVFWDRPWSEAGDERKLGEFLPGQAEYQRFPGHPAMTCLSPVLGFAVPYTTYDQKSWYYNLVPRVQDTGSKGGNQRPSQVEPALTDNERLFASVDELAFSPAFKDVDYRTAPDAFGSSNTKMRSRSVGDVLDRSRFFLTTSSRAPEVNLFNKPRVLLWPLQLSEKYRNAKDKLIAFCGTTGQASSKSIYYFQRLNEYSRDGVATINGRNKYTNPQSDPQSHEIPSSQHPTLDFMHPLVSRNNDLYQYLQRLTGKGTSIPGFGGNFEDKYGRPDRDQILTEMFDYIRTSVNSYNTALEPKYDYAPSRHGNPAPGETQLVPIWRDDNQTKGFGRFMTVPEVALVLFRSEAPPPRGSPAPEDIKVKAAIVLEQFNPTPGQATWSPHVRYAIRGLGSFQLNGQPLNLPDVQNGVPPFNLCNARVGRQAGNGHVKAFMGLLSQFRFYLGDPDGPKRVGTNGHERAYPFVSTDHVVIPVTADKLNFSGGSITIEIYSGHEQIPAGPALTDYPSRAPSQELKVQTLKIDFPDFTIEKSAFPEPAPFVNPQSGSGYYTDFDLRTRWGFGPSGDGKDDRPASDTFHRRLIHSKYDVVRSMEVDGAGLTKGDLRILAGMREVPPQVFKPHPKYFSSDVRMAHSLRSHGSVPGYNNGGEPTQMIAGLEYNVEPAAARGTTGARLYYDPSAIGDFDQSTGKFEDGPYINKADEGNTASDTFPYFSDSAFTVEKGESFSPNRQISSAVAFGSLPTGLKATEKAIFDNPADVNDSPSARPWQTLLFCPNPAARVSPPSFTSSGNKHPGFGTVIPTRLNEDGRLHSPPFRTPPDHLFLDLFTMPIVEPYAISEPLSTAGKVNLNFQIAPFTYIKRATALHAVLRSTKLTAIPDDSKDKSKTRRYEINPEVGGGEDGDGSKLEGTRKGTLWGFHEKFRAGDLFRSASQICDIHLVPVEEAFGYDKMDEFWRTRRRTGDNVREQPYGHIYPRVTTKSNSYTVHMRVQALRKSKNTPPDQWIEDRDQVLSEYRGSTFLERYIDPADPKLPDFAKTNSNANDNLDRHYRFRVLASKVFHP